MEGKAVMVTLKNGVLAANDKLRQNEQYINIVISKFIFHGGMG